MRRLICGLLFAASLASVSPAFAQDTPAEQANKQLVLDFYAALDQAMATGTAPARAQSIAETYLSPDYVQHAEALANLPGPGTARDKFIRLTQSVPEGMPPIPPATVVSVMAQDDLVMILTRREAPDPATGAMKTSYVFNMYRVSDGKLSEHWDIGGAPSGPPTGMGPGGPTFPAGPPGSSPPPQGPGPGLQGPPPGAPAGFMPPPPPPLTPAQQLVAALPGIGPAGLIPTPPVAPDAEMPSADPRDLQGTWFHNQALDPRIRQDMYGNATPFTMEGARILARRVTSERQGRPYVNASAICRPPGQQWQNDLNFPFQVFQSEDWIEFVYREYHGRWHIVLDPDAAPAPTSKAYMGRSIGHWEGDTLVVETRDWKQALWLDVEGTPLSADGKLVQRIRKVDSGNRKPFLEIVTTITDPKYYTDPWSIIRTYGWHPGLTLFEEYNCEEQIGAPDANADAGLVPEPTD